LRHGKARRRESARAPAAETRRDSDDERLARYAERVDPYSREADRRTAEGESAFRKDGTARREFSHVAGTEEHVKWTRDKRQGEIAAGWVERVDFDVEKVLAHPDGGQVRLDFVDYRRDVIVDHKPLRIGETDEQLAARYAKQRTRHIEAYEHATSRKVASYEYVTYSSPRDIFDIQPERKRRTRGPG